MAMRKKLNGNVKVIVERIDNLKEYIKEKFDENSLHHTEIFEKLSLHGNSISYLKALGYIGGGIVFVIIGILIKMNLG